MTEILSQTSGKIPLSLSYSSLNLFSHAMTTESLELVIVFFSGDPSRGMASGAIHHTHWMAKAFYAIKIYLFCDQFRLTAH